MKVDEVCYEWFTEALNKNIPLSGPLIRSKAKEISEKLHYQEFNASQGWLQKVLGRHNITYRSVSGEGASVSATNVENFKVKVPDLIRNYEPRDIYNIDETGLLYRALPDKTFALRGEKCIGGEMAKDRFTILLCVRIWPTRRRSLPLSVNQRDYVPLRI